MSGFRKTVIHTIYNGTLAIKKEQNLTTYDSMEGPRGYDAK